MREIKNDRIHVWLDDNGLWCGEARVWYSDTGHLQLHGNYDRDTRHGECIAYEPYGEVRWHRYYNQGCSVHDFAMGPLSDEEKMLLVLKYGGKLLS